MTFRKWLGYWTEVKRVVIVDGEPVVKQTNCCCEAPGLSRKECQMAHKPPTKTPCRCHCHSEKL